MCELDLVFEQVADIQQFFDSVSEDESMDCAEWYPYFKCLFDYNSDVPFYDVWVFNGPSICSYQVGEVPVRLRLH